jgi:hypothetical protein
MLRSPCDVVIAGAERALAESETRSVTAVAVEFAGRFDTEPVPYDQKEETKERRS